MWSPSACLGRHFPYPGAGQLLPTNRQAALVNSGWAAYDDPIQTLASIQLPELVPYGILFLFVPKEHVQEVWRLMSSWGLVYIENLTWVHLQADNAVRKDPSPYFCSSHTTLYMFRWSGLHLVPAPVYDTIETMLPGAKDKLLKLWAEPQREGRPGWTRVSFKPPDTGVQ
ncbi:hypothetical protein QBZ16_003941 [Prototheca wickerhamii]|uniref:Uncharacterized protein n=1 Tax=Prototheca wickerhamii TaxID=3111 RepID=A0AAD9IIB3_PROWI|nr:hypothetical protein QBZ16_003941 [Prototheca wickerhamii]